jgi:sulfite exporter TauE/SafE
VEALLLGLSSGLACLGSCGPVLLPCLAAEAKPARGTALWLGWFFGGRFLGYVGFSLLAWSLGHALPFTGRPRLVLFALAHLGLAMALAAHALGLRRNARPRCACVASDAADRPAPTYASVELSPRTLVGPCAPGAPLTLGFVTGLNLCPPFIAAGVRASERGSLAATLAYFVLFFLGTAVWFLPFLGMGTLRRIPQLAPVARIAAGIVAAYYAYLGTVTLAGTLIHA